MENNKGIEVHDRSATEVKLEGKNDDAIRRSAMRKISIRLLPLLALAEGVAQLQKVNMCVEFYLRRPLHLAFAEKKIVAPWIHTHLKYETDRTERIELFMTLL